MMKILKCAVIALILGAQGVAAETPVCRVDMQVVKVPAAHLQLCRDRIQEGDEWQRHIEKGDIQVIESGSVLSSMNQEMQMMLGKKVPIIYTDPRANGTQVNYIDDGFKLQVKAEEISPDQIRLNCMPQRSALNDPGNVHQGQNVFKAWTALVLKPGQVGLVSSTRGILSARYLKKVFPGTVFGEKDTLVMTLRVRR